MKPFKPRVTEIIKKVGLGKDFTGISPFYAERGSACHKAIELYLKGTLDESTIDETYKGHFEGFLKWWSDFKHVNFQTELHLENQDYQGTIDLIMADVLYDFKCSKSHDRVAEIQGAGYKNLAKNDGPFIIVQLPGDGTYQLTEYRAPINLWEATWTLYKWKTKT